MSVADGRHHFHYDEGNQQCDLALASNDRRYLPSIQNLLTLPLSEIPENAEINQVSARKIYSFSDEQISFREERTHEDDFVFHRLLDRSNRAQATWQLFPHRVGSVLFPTIIVQAQFQEEKLTRAEVVVFDQIELLVEVPGDSFAMNVPAGTNVVDYRAVERDEAGRRSRNGVIRGPTFDLLRRIGDPEPREPGIRYGDAAPAIQAKAWCHTGSLVNEPELDNKIRMICMFESDAQRHTQDLPDLRRAAQRFSENPEIAVIAILGPDTLQSQLLEFSSDRQLPCFVAIDQVSDDAAGRSRGKTRSAFQVPHLPVSIVVDQFGAIRYYGSHVGHVDGAAKYVEQLLEN